jgi:hypothetical protein
MLSELDKALEILPTLLDTPTVWDSLIINRRKPATYRVFTKLPNGLRICLHKFEACDSHEAFSHPHPWPGAFVVLSGSYKMNVWKSDNIEDFTPKPVVTTVLTTFSRYEITNPLTWHSVIPLQPTYTVMVNGEPWPEGVVHKAAPTTKGKDLDKMPADALKRHLDVFKGLVRYYNQQNELHKYIATGLAMGATGAISGFTDMGMEGYEAPAYFPLGSGDLYDMINPADKKITIFDKNGNIIVNKEALTEEKLQQYKGHYARLEE